MIEKNKNEKSWWDNECREKKKEVRKELRKWRKREGDRDRYRQVKRQYTELCERKKRGK